MRGLARAFTGRWLHRLPGQGVREYLAAEVALRAIVYAATRALKRGDVHEANHYLAMTLYGNSNHPDGCNLPGNFDQLVVEYRAEAQARRAAREAAR